jgi:hypothetical protein
MIQVVVDATIRSKLQTVLCPVELCDETGKVLGRFIPQLDPAQWEPLTPEISEEELQRRLKANEKRYTTAEVLAHLEKL